MVTPTDRRRFLVATVVTALALPFLVHELTKKGHDSTPVGAASPVAGAQVGPGSSGPQASVQPQVSAPLTVAPGAPAAATNQVEGKVGFRLYDPAQWGVRPCAASGIAVNTRVTITNLNNGKTTQCIVVNDSRGVGREHLLELADTVFAEIADPTVGVIPARIAW